MAFPPYCLSMTNTTQPVLRFTRQQGTTSRTTAWALYNQGVLVSRVESRHSLGTTWL